MVQKQSCVSGGVSVAVRAVRPTQANQRGKLRAQLRSKTIQTGTRWLAKELGYKNEGDYLRNLKESEIARLVCRHLPLVVSLLADLLWLALALLLSKCMQKGGCTEATTDGVGARGGFESSVQPFGP